MVRNDAGEDQAFRDNRSAEAEIDWGMHEGCYFITFEIFDASLESRRDKNKYLSCGGVKVVAAFDLGSSPK